MINHLKLLFRLYNHNLFGDKYIDIYIKVKLILHVQNQFV